MFLDFGLVLIRIRVGKTLIRIIYYNLVRSAAKQRIPRYNRWNVSFKSWTSLPQLNSIYSSDILVTCSSFSYFANVEQISVANFTSWDPEGTPVRELDDEAAERELKERAAPCSSATFVARRLFVLRTSRMRRGACITSPLTKALTSRETRGVRALVLVALWTRWVAMGWRSFGKLPDNVGTRPGPEPWVAENAEIWEQSKHSSKLRGKRTEKPNNGERMPCRSP